MTVNGKRNGNIAVIFERAHECRELTAQFQFPQLLKSLVINQMTITIKVKRFKVDSTQNKKNYDNEEMSLKGNL